MFFSGRSSSCRLPFQFPQWRVLCGALLLLAPPGVGAQIAGNFVVPSLRGGDDSRFAYWDLFSSGPDGTNYQFNNVPGLLGGVDAEGNQGDLTGDEVAFLQIGSEGAFVTSSGAIYDFARPTAFEVLYTGAEASELTNVIFQTLSGGQPFDRQNIRLVPLASDGGVEELSLLPQFKALDDPATGQFAERVVSAFEWDLTGMNIGAFAIRFAAPGSSQALWEAQLDVSTGPFQQELGYILVRSSLPRMRTGALGTIYEDLPFDAELRFHLPGTEFELLADSEPGFAHVGWFYQNEVTEGERLSIEFTDSDLSVSSIHAPLTYEDWRKHIFFSFNPTIGQEADSTNEDFSGAEADPDGDGLSNLEEYAFGGDPYRRDAAVGEPSLTMNRDSPTLMLSFNWSGANPAETDLSYEIQRSGDLRTWVAMDREAVEVIEGLLLANGYRRMHCRIPADDLSAAFFRIVITRAE
ncbi:MAG: hypothetical protein AAF514_15215 [Verrucomicrobiota bacterium]